MRGDVFLRKVETWKAMQRSDVSLVIKYFDFFLRKRWPAIHAALRRDLPGYARATGLSKKQAEAVMARHRAGFASAWWPQRQRRIFEERFEINRPLPSYMPPWADFPDVNLPASGRFDRPGLLDKLGKAFMPNHKPMPVQEALRTVGTPQLAAGCRGEAG